MSDEQKTSIKSLFRTKDLNQAAFVWCQEGVILKRLEGVSSRNGRGTTVFFIFELPMPEEELGKLIFEYANRCTVVEPQEFCSKQNNLKDLLHCNLTKNKKVG